MLIKYELPRRIRRNELVDLSSHPSLFHGIALICIFGSVFIGLLQWQAGQLWNRYIAISMIFFSALACEALVAYRRHRVAYLVLIWTVWLAASVQASVRGGLSNPGLYLYPVVILMSGWLLGVRHALAALVGSGLVLMAMAAGQQSGALVPAPGLGPMTQGATMSIILILCFVALRLFLKNHWTDITSIQSLNEKLEATVTRLSASEASYRVLNEELEERVVKRTADLSSALLELERTKEELIQAGKLSALGNLVAGVAHELNTPIGNALVAASTLSDNAKTVQIAHAGNQLRRTQLDGFLQSVEDGMDLVQRSLLRSSDLVRSFKQVAVDQASERRRTFELKTTVDEVFSTLRPNFKNTSWEFSNHIPAGITLDSYPGADG